MKILKPLLIILGLVLLGAAVLAGSGFFLLRGEPEWYRRRPQSADNAAATLENKLVVYYDRMAAAHAWRERHPQASAAAATRIASARTAPGPAAPIEPAADPTLKPFEIQFTDAELNAFFDKWAGADGRRESIDPYVQDPRLLIQPGKLLLAGTVRDLGAVVSIEIVPRLDDAGELRLTLSRAYAGLLPLPEVVWGSRREQVERSLKRTLPRDQASARISPDGVANAAAAAAAMKLLLLGALDQQPTEPVLFLPYDAAHPGRGVPVKLEALTLGDGTITMRVREMDASERSALLEHLRSWRGQTAAEAAASTPPAPPE